jgi:hypothetical protein
VEPHEPAPPDLDEDHLRRFIATVEPQDFARGSRPPLGTDPEDFEVFAEWLADATARRFRRGDRLTRITLQGPDRRVDVHPRRGEPLADVLARAAAEGRRIAALWYHVGTVVPPGTLLSFAHAPRLCIERVTRWEIGPDGRTLDHRVRGGDDVDPGLRALLG